MAAKKRAPAKKKTEELDEHGLTAKEREVADLFRGGPDEIRGNAKLCYKQVFPRCKLSTAETEGPKLLRKPQVQAYLDKMAEEVAEKADITEQMVLEALGKIGFCDPRKMFKEDGSLLPVNEWPDDIAFAVSSIEVLEEFDGRGAERVHIGYTKKVRFWDKNSALEKIGKHLKMFVERMEHTGKNGGPIETKPVDLSQLSKEDRAALAVILKRSSSKS